MVKRKGQARKRKRKRLVAKSRNANTGKVPKSIPTYVHKPLRLKESSVATNSEQKATTVVTQPRTQNDNGR